MCIDSINFFEKGYYVFRVGKISEERLKINNKNSMILLIV